MRFTVQGGGIASIWCSGSIQSPVACDSDDVVVSFVSADKSLSRNDISRYQLYSQQTQTSLHAVTPALVLLLSRVLAEYPTMESDFQSLLLDLRAVSYTHLTLPTT